MAQAQRQRRRRDGQPQQPPSPDPGTAAAAAAYGAGAALGAGVAPGAGGAVIASTPEVAAISSAAAAILASFDVFLASRSQDENGQARELLLSEFPGVHEDTIGEVVDGELARERTFRAKARDRLARDLPNALMISNPTDRADAVNALLAREQRYLEQRDEAVALRALGAIETHQVLEKSPGGAYWKLSDNVSQHTLDCLAMGGKVWPRSVIETYHPPLHHGCACELIPVGEAIAAGYIAPNMIPPAAEAADMAAHAMAMQETAWDSRQLELELRLLEAVYDVRWPAGTEHGGRFRPKRGGDPGRRLLRATRGLRRDHLPEGVRGSGMAAPPTGESRELVDRHSHDLRVGDRVKTGTGFREVTATHHDKSPGLVELEGIGLAGLDDRHYKTYAAEAHPEPRMPQPGSLTHEQVKAVTTMREPETGGELAHPFHFDPTARRKREEGDKLILGKGFFTLKRPQKESVLFRHLSKRITGGMNEQELEHLRGVDSHFAKNPRKAIEDGYLALSSDGFERFHDLHPAAARAIAEEAQTRGLPLRPEVHRLVNDFAEGRDRRHPAEQVAERIKGLDDVDAMEHLRDAGYHHVEHDYEKRVLTFRNFETHGLIKAHFHPDTMKIDNVETHVDEGHPEARRKAEHIRDFPFAGDARAELEKSGYIQQIRSGEWDHFTHPHGYGVAVRNDENGKVLDAQPYSPTVDEQIQAEKVAIRRDPLNEIKRGMDMEHVRRSLMGGMSWQHEKTVEHRVSQGGATSTFIQHNGDEKQHVRISHENGKVTAVGRPDLPGDTGFASEEKYRAQQDMEKRAREEIESGRLDEQVARQHEIEAAVEANDQRGLERALARQTPNDAAVQLRGMGWQIVNRRRSRDKRTRDPRISYTLRSSKGDTVIIGGTHSFGSSKVDKVTLKQAPRHERVRLNRDWKTLGDFEQDALGRVDELADRHGAKSDVNAIIYGSKRDHAAVHEWNGTVVLGKEVKPSIKRYIEARKKGEPLTDEQALDFYSALETVQHEINHGVNPLESPSSYRGPGIGWEEALTEETAHHGTVEWLASMGADDVLAAVARHPNDSRVKGVYLSYRKSMGKIMDEAGVPQQERTDTLHRMKFQMGPNERVKHLSEKIVARHGKGMGTAQRRGVEHMPDEHQTYWLMSSGNNHVRDFEPVTRPDLAAYQTELSHANLMHDETQRVKAGDQVEVEQDRAVLPKIGTVEKITARQNPETARPADLHGNANVHVLYADGDRAIVDPTAITSVSPREEGGELGARRETSRHVTAGGRKLSLHNPVMVDVSAGAREGEGAQIAGEVIELDGRGTQAKIRTVDGMELWYSLDSGRVH